MNPAPAAPVVVPRRLVRFAVDSDQLDQLFAADFVRTYADLVPDTAAVAALQARFPDSAIELIDRGLGDPAAAATIADIEDGALTPAEGADRIRAWHAEGRTDLLTYCSEGILPQVIEACAGLPHWKWIAAWGRLVVPGHRDAQVQFANAAMLGLHADLSIVWNPAYRPAGLGLAAAPGPAAPVGGTAPAAAARLGDPGCDHTDELAKLRAIYEAAKTHHGGLTVVARDAEQIFELVGQHAGLLAELAHLTL